MVDSYPLAVHFDKAANDLKNLKKRPDNDELLNLYGLFKQANEGDNTSEEPSFYQLEKKSKWKAWSSQKGKSTAQAKHEYVATVIKLLPESDKSGYN